MASTDNPNPVVYEGSTAGALKLRSLDELMVPDMDCKIEDALTSQEVFESVRYLQDPEHPDLSLEQLKVIEEKNIFIQDSWVFVRFTPTVPTCSVATLIGLTMKAKLQRSLPRKYKVDVEVTPGTHDQEQQVNKQLNDKERVAAALENPALRTLINRGIAGTDKLVGLSLLE
mmetsp:Transcript_54324/g.129456  ORF Transcript_54324/g.129456 Transcript_54324/m.129456 type:complete len:172 (+) Transcript_54324:75-590(+)